MLLALALIALSIRVATPPGYMISSGAGGQIEVMLCGGAHMLVSLSGHRGPHQDLPGTDGHCLFAASATAAPAAIAPRFLAPAFGCVLASIGTERTRIGERLAAPPPPSTGPPTLT
jgi:hypothetical protein